MKIGIKYCGGCNPRYDRKKAVDEIKHELKDIHEIVRFSKEEKVDGVIIVCGCSSRCVKTETKADKIYITNRESVKEVIKKLRGR